MTPTRTSGGAAARRIALVLGGGGIKGFAHIGVLKALEERGIKPTLYAGTSIGAMIAAAAVGGMPAEELARRAESLKRRDLFRINHFGMLMDRMKSQSIYLEEPLRALTNAIAPAGTFNDLPSPLLVNTVDLERGTQIVWGLPGLRDVSVRDAVYASCSLPGFFPPGKVDGRMCVDGGVIDNMPTAISGLGMDMVIAVDVGSSDTSMIHGIAQQGFATIYMRAATTMMHALQGFPLAAWSGPPMLLIRPKVGQEWLSFSNSVQHIREGYRAAAKALEHFDTYMEQPGGIFPRKRVELNVIREKCIGCGLCAALAPTYFGLDSTGKAFARTKVVEWSAADGDFVCHCPTLAIEANRIDLVTPPQSAELVDETTPTPSKKVGAA
ncbi:MAG TPA: patatin-like phospholipase family protein [Gemmatimonadaceae bacterium]|nr:patatin-like phospholipase family protein [Gemmatimonadaceae bacterium]